MIPTNDRVSKVELVPSQPGSPNARFVLSQPSARMPDGSVRELQPYEVVVTHRIGTGWSAVITAVAVVLLVLRCLEMLQPKGQGDR